MKVKISDLIPLRAEIFKYSDHSKLLEEYSFSHLYNEEITLLENTLNVQPNCNVYHVDVTLTFDAHVESVESKFSVEIPIFLFQDVSSNNKSVSDGLQSDNDIDKIIINNEKIILLNNYKNCVMRSTFYLEDIITINKTILGKSWKYWFEQCGYRIIFERTDT